METIKQVLMRRDDMTDVEAQHQIDEARAQMTYYLESGDIDSAYDICAEFFSLESDYLDELL